MTKKVSKLILIYILLLVVITTLSSCQNATSISFEKKTYVIMVDEEFSPEVKISPKKADYDFLVGNPTLLSLNYKIIKGLKEGASEITVTSGDKTDTAIVVVLKEPLPPKEPGEDDNSCMVFFITDDNSIPSKNVAYGSILEEPDIVTPSGYVLDGYFTDRNYITKFDFNTPIYEDTYLYVKYTITDAEFDFTLMPGYVILDKLKYPNVPYTKIVIPNEINSLPVTELRSAILNGNKTLQEITIPENVQIIGKRAFTGCSALKKVTIEGNNLREIGEEAFGKCTELTEMVLPNSITELGARSFAECSKLAKINIPNKLTELKGEVFRNTAITSVSLKNIEVLGYGVFMNCKSLKTVTDYSKVASVDHKNTVEVDAQCFEGTQWYNNQLNAKPDADNSKYKGGVYLGNILLFVNLKEGNWTIAIKPTTTYIARGAIIADKGYVEFSSFTAPRAEDMFMSAKANGTGKNISENLFLVIPNTDAYGKALTMEENKLVVADNLGIDKMEAFRGYDKNRNNIYIRKYNGTAEEITINYQSQTIKLINTGAFSSNSNIKKITFICFALTKIEGGAFNKCVNLEKVIINSDGHPATIVGNSFSILHTDFKIYVPSNKLALYKSTWSPKETRIEAI